MKYNVWLTSRFMGVQITASNQAAEPKQVKQRRHSALKFATMPLCASDVVIVLNKLLKLVAKKCLIFLPLYSSSNPKTTWTSRGAPYINPICR